MDELVFAIPTAEVWDILPYREKGLIPGHSDDLKRIVAHGRFRRRAELEDDPTFQQLITYAIISTGGSFYLFKRSSRQAEKRLHNKYSLGVGGHMNPCHMNGHGVDYLMDELSREFFEEVRLGPGCRIEKSEFIGFLNDDTIPVGQVHIGLLFHIRVSGKEVYVNEPDKMTANWIEQQHLANYYEEMESWSGMIVEHYIH